MKQTLKAQALFNYTQNLRRDFHRHPELGFQEVRTAGIVARELQSLGLEVTTGIAETGVAAVLEGCRPGPTVMLRFDMDALPIQEVAQVEYASQTPGVMHACGHDGHVAVGLTVARLLQERRAEFPGRVKLVFQPAEEGLGGAAHMIRAGVLSDPRPDFALGLHLWNENPVGWFCIAPGPVMAAAEKFCVKLVGRGGHGAIPQEAIDPLPAAAQILSALQTIVSRNISPLEAAVISVTSLHAGETFNVIPSEVELCGTIRSFEEATRALVLERFGQVVQGIAVAMGCQAQVDLQPLTPAVINDPQVAARLQTVARQMFPTASLATRYRTMGSEDMAFFLRQIPGCFFFVGSANVEQELSAGHHHPAFDFDERALPLAADLMVAATLDLLQQPCG